MFVLFGLLLPTALLTGGLRYKLDGVDYMKGRFRTGCLTR